MKRNRHTILLKGCPRCRGDLFYEPWERQRLCLQCGHRLSRGQERELLASVRGQRGGLKGLVASALDRSGTRLGVTPLV